MTSEQLQIADVQPHILIVDDDERIRSLLAKYLGRNGFLVTTAKDAGHAYKILAGLEFDLIVLDVMMPGENGLELTKRLRDDKVETPILLLTALGETENRIEGFETGADDYLSKPFEPKELLLRIASILKRIPKVELNEQRPRQIMLGNFRYDTERGELWNGQKMVRLTSTENHLLKVLAVNCNSPVERSALVEELAAKGSEVQERAIDVQITRLRRKIEADPKTPRYLQTVRGQGYMLAPD